MYLFNLRHLLNLRHSLTQIFYLTAMRSMGTYPSTLFYIIRLGLSDEKDVTVRGLEVVYTLSLHFLCEGNTDDKATTRDISKDEELIRTVSDWCSGYPQSISLAMR